MLPGNLTLSDLEMLRSPPVFTKMFKHRDFSPVLSPTPLQLPGQKVSAARPHSPIKSLSPRKGGPGLTLASAWPSLPGLHECVPQRPFGVSSKQTSGVGDSESARWHHTLLGKPHPFRGKFTQLTANMGYLYPQPQAGPTPTYLLSVGILGMVRYDWVCWP